jgi:hypothetical protein
MSKVAAIWLTALVVATQATPAYPKVYNLVKEQAPLTRLTIDTLRSAVSGMRIGLDLTKLQASAPFTEDFASDGRWRLVRQERALRIELGRWLVKNDQLCVLRAGQPTVCRFAFSDKSSRLYLSSIDNCKDCGSLLMTSNQLVW